MLALDVTLFNKVQFVNKHCLMHDELTMNSHFLQALGWCECTV